MYINEDIVAPWCVGTKDDWYLDKIAKILKKIFKKLNVKNNKIMF